MSSAPPIRFVSDSVTCRELALCCLEPRPDINISRESSTSTPEPTESVQKSRVAEDHQAVNDRVFPVLSVIIIA